MEFDTRTTAVAFLALIAPVIGVSLATPTGTRTVLMMVLPALVIYGLLALALGVEHGEHHAGNWYGRTPLFDVPCVRPGPQSEPAGRLSGDRTFARP